MNRTRKLQLKLYFIEIIPILILVLLYMVSKNEMKICKKKKENAKGQEEVFDKI